MFAGLEFLPRLELVINFIDLNRHSAGLGHQDYQYFLGGLSPGLTQPLGLERPS